MKQLRILAVGRIKTPYWQEAITYYQKRLIPSIRLTEQWVKDGDAALPLEKRLQIEQERLSKLLLPNDTIICLDEHGKTQTSPQFAKWLSKKWDTNKAPVFIIGGAFGLSLELKNRAHHLYSFGKLTLPHELARVVLYEQLYRAENILNGTGYHHE